ncbi:MAG: glycosyltransferase family 1 protein [Segetibacter sp.]|nr:glycosyltransferase family 1 protein [Segetibacter sp.]
MATASTKILITSPSLDVNDNVSGISSLVSDIINHSRFDFIHFKVGSKDGLKKRLGWALKQVGVFINLISVSITKKFEVVHLNVGLETYGIIRDGLFFFILKNVFHKKVILHAHGGYFLMNAPKNAVISFLLRKMFEQADKVIVLSNLEQNIVSERYGRLPFVVLPNAVDTSYINSLSKDDKREVLKFVFMGRISTTKGIYAISESLKYLGDYFDRFSLHIYGAGLELENWLNELNKYKGFQFHYHGVIGGFDKWRELNNSDIFLLPAIHSEGMPVAMLEAMAAGCVVLVNDVASIKTVVENGVNGILLSESTPEALSDQIKKVIDGEFNLEAIGHKAKEFILNNHCLAKYVKRLDGLYSTMQDSKWN